MLYLSFGLGCNKTTLLLLVLFQIYRYRLVVRYLLSSLLY
nr:MAG TPA: hypothetical protein [Caudoviricetes sp.]